MPKLPLPSAALATRVAVVVFGVALLVEQGITDNLLQPRPSLAAAPGYGVDLLAPAFFVWALWESATVFGRLDRGEAFGPAMARGLNRIGAGLMLGSWCAIVLEPGVAHLVADGFSGMRGVKFAFTVENLTLAFTGLVLILLARRGRALQSTLDQFV